MLALASYRVGLCIILIFLCFLVFPPFLQEAVLFYNNVILNEILNN